jgi:aspartate/methionine/tyrosine aminotransferase
MELGLIAELAAEHDLYTISDEVYEHFVWDDARRTSSDAPWCWICSVTFVNSPR